MATAGRLNSGGLQIFIGGAHEPSHIHVHIQQMPPKKTKTPAQQQQHEAAAPAPSPKLQAKARTIRTILDHLFPDPPIPLDHKDTFTLLIAVILSAQTTDGKVNQVTPELFRLAPTPQALAAMPYDKVRLDGSMS